MTKSSRKPRQNLGTGWTILRQSGYENASAAHQYPANAEGAAGKCAFSTAAPQMQRIR